MNAASLPHEQCAVPVPANLWPYVDALGCEKGVDFLLMFGGATMYFPRRPRDGQRSMAAQLLTQDEIMALSAAIGCEYTRVPVAKKFIANYLRNQNVSIGEIARRLHMTDVSVRKYLKPKEHQLPLPLP